MRSHLSFNRRHSDRGQHGPWTVHGDTVPAQLSVLLCFLLRLLPGSSDSPPRGDELELPPLVSKTRADIALVRDRKRGTASEVQMTTEIANPLARKRSVDAEKSDAPLHLLRLIRFIRGQVRVHASDSICDAFGTCWISPSSSISRVDFKCMPFCLLQGRSVLSRILRSTPV